ncbi:MFS transporter [Paenibacillus beijingensis]|uniref:MFS transporter n=1 Tax=Paenibacillus beijingensis TaxID=1126833 RepID=A0A0D5NRU7_9BACL|nr:MFS transporter [Paenibacillus beijingensis]AJY77608.1 MFS transporter [Paenibacillus beijingensis]
MQAKKKRDLLALASIPLIMTLGNSMLIPVLPVIQNKLGISPLQSSMLITVYSVMAIVLIPLAGYMSDRIGRKAVIIPSLILAGIGGAVCGAAAGLSSDAYSIILFGRVLQGIGAAGAMPIVMPLVGDMFRSEEQVSAGLGLIETSNTFGKVLSPIAGSALAALIWSVPFWAIPVMCLISILLVIFMVKAPKKKERKPPPASLFLKTTLQLYKDKSRWLTALFAIGGIGMFILFGLLFYLSETLEGTYRMKGVLKGFVLAIPLAALCTASFVTGKVIGRRKKLMKWLTTGSFVLSAAAILSCLPFEAVAARIAFLSAAGLGIGIALPCLDALLTEGIDKKQRGTISSLYSSMRFAGVAAGPPVASLLMRHATPVLFWFMACASAAAGLIALSAIRPGERKQPVPGRKLAGGGAASP